MIFINFHKNFYLNEVIIHSFVISFKMFKFILFILSIASSEALITYQLYTRNNRYKGQPLVFRNAASVITSSYNGERKTKVVIHGYGQSGRSKFSRDMKNAFLSEDDDNVIIGKSYLEFHS